MLIEITYNVTDVYMSTTETPIYVEISFEQPGGSSAVWGAITGTLSNQTDLQNALDAKLDESTIDGGTEGQILVKNSATDFDFAWINNYAKYLATNVRNQTGSTIGAFQVVYISGATGNKPLISLADADTEATSSKTYGVTATSIANNGTGDVVTVGELSGIDTSAFTEGDSLWLSSTAGGVVTSPPAEPAHSVFIGTVIRSHPTLGVIDVAIANGYELTELHGVQITTPTDNQGLFYNSTSTLWENKSITTALGYTPVPTTRNITINGVTYDLSADRTWTIAAGISGSGTSGQVTYWTGASAVSGSNNLFWDASNNRLGIGTNTPVSDLQINKNVDGVVRVRLDNTSTGGSAAADIYIRNSVGGAVFQITGTGNTVPNVTANQARFRTDSGVTNGFTFLTGGTAPITFGTNDIVGMTMFGSTRNVVLQNGGTFIDNGQRLQVYGDTLLRGSGATSATTALTVQNSSSTNLFTVRNDVRVGIATNAPTAALDIWNATDNAQLRISDSRVTIPDYSGVGFSPVMGTRTLGFLAPWSSSTGGVQFSGFTSNTNTGTPFAFVGIHGGTSPTTPALRLRGWKHNGTTGLAVLTGTEIIAGFNTGNNADVFQVKANGTINMSSLPTSSTGLVAGDLWNDAGTVKIV